MRLVEYGEGDGVWRGQWNMVRFMGCGEVNGVWWSIEYGEVD